MVVTVGRTAAGVRVERVALPAFACIGGAVTTTNAWLLGDDDEVVVIDTGVDHRHVLAAVGDRAVSGIVLTHGHSDHSGGAAALRRETGAPLWLHPADVPLWCHLYTQRSPDRSLDEGVELTVGDATVHVRYTPGHTPGSVCLVVPELAAVFTGDTLLRGGPPLRASHPATAAAVRRSILSLPGTTVVHPGHGEDTTVAEEAPDLDR